MRIRVIREKPIPLTFEGFKSLLFERQFDSGFDSDRYFTDGVHEDLSASPHVLRRIIRQDQIRGGMAGIYNPSLTARINGLTDKVETSHKIEQPLFADEPQKLDK